MINRLFLSLFLIIFSCNITFAQFKATLTADKNELIVTFAHFGGNITTDFGSIEFFIRTNDITTPFMVSTPIVNSSNFPGTIPIVLKNDDTNITSGYRTLKFGPSSSIASGSSQTYLEGISYEFARITLSGGGQNSAIFELISDLSTLDSKLTINNSAGNDLTFSTCIITNTCSMESVFYGDFLSGFGTSTSTESTDIMTPVLLPVELSSFVGWNEGKMNKLKWVTQSEENSSHFEIQKSVNGEDFERIGTVHADGNSASAIDYDFDDANPFLEENYYRLKIIDLDDTYEYSETILIKTSGKASIKGFPNPFRSTISFELSSPISGTAQISLYDIIGKQVLFLEREIESGLSSQNLELDYLTKGTYIVKVLLPNSSEYLSTKIIKNNK